MPIKLPNLDDRTFADLVAEAKTLIPVHAPEWTNHNEADPGITLIELFAYLTEISIYRLNRVTDANVCAFLKLMDGIERAPSDQNRGMVSVANRGEVALQDEVRDVVLNLRQQDRAVTCEDFERLALDADSAVGRAKCIPRRDLSSETPYQTADAHVSVIVVPAERMFDKVFWFDDVFCDIIGGVSAGIEPPVATPDARLYLGATTIFESIKFKLVTPGKGYTLTFEYFNGKNWVKLTPDQHKLSDTTSNLALDGAVTFTAPLDWQSTAGKDANAYWIRISNSTVAAQRAAVELVGLPKLIDQVSSHLEPRRLLTTRVHVVGPDYVSIGVNVQLALKSDAEPEPVRQQALHTLVEFLNPQLWPLGRDVYVSEIYSLLDHLKGVDFVTALEGSDVVTASGVADDRRILMGKKVVGISLNPNELANASLVNSQIVAVPSAEKKMET